jgi:hypothetical protein
MDPDKINTIAFRAAAIVICAFLVIGGIGACVNHQYMKGGVGFLVTPIIIFVGLKPASIKTWAIMIAIFAIAMYFVGAIGN